MSPGVFYKSGSKDIFKPPYIQMHLLQVPNYYYIMHLFLPQSSLSFKGFLYISSLRGWVHAGTSLFGCMRLPGISWTIEKFKSNGNTRPSPVDRRKCRLYLRRISSSGNVGFFPVGELLKGIIGTCVLKHKAQFI